MIKGIFVTALVMGVLACSMTFAKPSSRRPHRPSNHTGILGQHNFSGLHLGLLGNHSEHHGGISGHHNGSIHHGRPRPGHFHGKNHSAGNGTFPRPPKPLRPMNATQIAAFIENAAQHLNDGKNSSEFIDEFFNNGTFLPAHAQQRSGNNGGQQQSNMNWMLPMMMQQSSGNAGRQDNGAAGGGGGGGGNNQYAAMMAMMMQQQNQGGHRGSG